MKRIKLGLIIWGILLLGLAKGCVDVPHTVEIIFRYITATALNGVTSPVADATAVSTVNNSDAGFTGTITWTPALLANKFAYNTDYTAKITLTAAEGFVFNSALSDLTSIAKFTVDGIAPTKWINNNDTTLVFEVKFPITDKKQLAGKVEILLDRNEGTLSADTTNVMSSGTINYKWLVGGSLVNSNSNTLPVNDYDLGQMVSLELTADANSGKLTDSITVYMVNIELEDNVIGDTAFISAPFGPYGMVDSTIFIAYELTESGAVSNTITYSGGTVDSVLETGKGTSIYIIDKYDATNGVITITATFEHTKTITIAEIEGITPPVAEATPVTEITDTVQFSGTVTWKPVDATFKIGTVYTATIELTAKKGYTFTGVEKNFFKVNGADAVSNSENSGVITAVFPETIEAPETEEIENEVSTSKNLLE